MSRALHRKIWGSTSEKRKKRRINQLIFVTAFGAKREIVGRGSYQQNRRDSGSNPFRAGTGQNKLGL